MKDFVLGELISTMYNEFLEEYGDGVLAAAATVACINELISESSHPSREEAA